MSFDSLRKQSKLGSLTDKLVKEVGTYFEVRILSPFRYFKKSFVHFQISQRGLRGEELASK